MIYTYISFEFLIRTDVKQNSNYRGFDRDSFNLT